MPALEVLGAYFLYHKWFAFRRQLLASFQLRECSSGYLVKHLTPNALANVNNLPKSDVVSLNPTDYWPWLLILDYLSDNRCQVVDGGQCDADVLVPFGDDRPTLLIVHEDGKRCQVFSSPMRISQVVQEQTRLDESVLENLERYNVSDSTR
jgi:hypothetical protein